MTSPRPAPEPPPRRAGGQRPFPRLHTGAAPQQEAQPRRHVGRSGMSSSPPPGEAPGLPTWRRGRSAPRPIPRFPRGEPAGQSGIVGRVHHSLSRLT